MKKILLYSSLFLAGTMLLTANVNAEVISTQSGTGKQVVLPDTNGSGPGLRFDPSPSCLISIVSITNAYAIEAMNTAAADGDRNEYGVWSGNTGYFQLVSPADAVSATPVTADFTVDFTTGTDLTATPFGSDWVNMGGGGS